MQTMRHDEERQRRRSPWAWLKVKLGTVGATLVVAALVLGMGAAAWAAFSTRADVNDTVVSTGTIDLQFQGTPSAFALTTDANPKRLVSIPAHQTCTVTVEPDGSLTIAVGGLFPGEGCAFHSWELVNGSDVDLSSFALDLGTTLASGTQGASYSAGVTELVIWVGDYLDPGTGNEYAQVDPATEFGTVAPAGNTLAAYGLIVQRPADAPADGTAVSISGLGFTALTP